MSNGNLFLLVTNEFAKQTLDAVSFPVKIAIPDSLPETGDFSLGEAKIDIADEGRANGYADDEDRTAVLLREGQTQADDEDVEIFNAYKVDANDPLPEEGKTRRLGKFRKTLLQPFKRILSVELVWVKMEVDKPDFVLSDPILIKDMVVRIQVQFRACAKMFGKKITKIFTTELITLEARQLELALHTSGAKVSVLPSFTDVDVMLNFSMLGFAFTSQPGITSIVNKQLHKRGAFEILDLSSFEKGIPFSSSKLRVASIVIAPDQKGLIINMAMSVS
ncbi:MAG: hypothetical protein V4628_17285 [Pseudomonadota bacterium]